MVTFDPQKAFRPKKLDARLIGHLTKIILLHLDCRFVFRICSSGDVAASSKQTLSTIIAVCELSRCQTRENSFSHELRKHGYTHFSQQYFHTEEESFVKKASRTLLLSHSSVPHVYMKRTLLFVTYILILKTLLMKIFQ